VSIDSHQKQVRIKNESCFPITVWVNQGSHVVLSKSEKILSNNEWSAWKWNPGIPGSLAEKKIPTPLKNKLEFQHGPGTVPTHEGSGFYGYDFHVPENTPVLAMESGTVIRVIEHYETSHRDLSRVQEVNKVEVLHSDGSVAVYGHLKKDGVLPSLCEQVKAGQTIGFSGNTGFSSGPHLHVEVFRPTGKGDYQTMPLKFLPSPSE
jgi:murein DD-endopeptidase MepM/ murein hydrolase activator NlpD